MQRNINRRTEAQAILAIKHDPISKMINAKRAGGVTSVGEHRPSQHKALSSTPNTAKKKKCVLGNTYGEIMV
jgi:hypothetical protein